MSSIRTLSTLSLACGLLLGAVPASAAPRPQAPLTTPSVAPVLLRLPMGAGAPALEVDERVLAGLAQVTAPAGQDAVPVAQMMRDVAVLHALLARLPQAVHQESAGIATPEAARASAALAAAAERLSGQPSASTLRTLKAWKPAPLRSEALQALWPRTEGLAPAQAHWTTEQEQAAAKLTVLAPSGHAKADQGVGPAITVAELLRQVDVQGRTLLQQGDVGFARALATQLLRQRLALRQLREEEGWSGPQVHALDVLLQERQALADRQLALGLTNDPHHRSAHLEALMAEVSPQDIASHYTAHPEAYRKTIGIEWVSAQCQPETRPCMDGLRSAADRGVSLFSLWGGAPVPPEGALIQHWRWSDDQGVTPVAHPSGRTLPVPELPRDWLLQLAMAQPERDVSALVRLPGAPAVALPGSARKPAAATAAASSASVYVQVTERRWGQHPLDSETVRHLARQAVAQEKLQAQWQMWLKSAQQDAAGYTVAMP